MRPFLIGNEEKGLEVNPQRTKYMFVSFEQNFEQNKSIQIGDQSTGNVAQFRYLEITQTNKNVLPEEVKSRVNSRNGCCQSVQNLLSAHLIPKIIKL